MNQHFTEKAQREIEESFQLDRDAWRLLNLVVSEWESDPMSVQCFDLRIVEEAQRVISRRKQLDASGSFINDRRLT